jgi:Spy/CpxP family protein refolding chaperone
MTFMKNKVLVLLGILLAVAVGRAQEAGRGFMGCGPGTGLNPASLDDLDLTQTQQGQVRDIFKSNRQDFQNAMKTVFSARLALEQAVAANPADDAAVRARSTELGSAETELTSLEAKVRSQIVALLTTDQKQKLDQIEQDHWKHLQRMLDRMGQAGPNGS